MPTRHSVALGDIFDSFVNASFITERVYETEDGSIEYYKNGRLHNEKGPAVIKKDGKQEYWLNGRQVTEKDVIGVRKKYTIELYDDEKVAIEKYLGRKLA
jgi:hypothetical protein